MLEEIQGGIHIGDGLILSPKSCWYSVNLSDRYDFNNKSKTDGYLNTIMLMAKGKWFYLEHNGYNDWFIPSYEDMKIISKIEYELPPKYSILQKTIWTSTYYNKYGDGYYYNSSVGFTPISLKYSLTLTPVRRMT